MSNKTDYLVGWFNPFCLLPPHKITRPEQVDELEEVFKRDGWDMSKPILTAYLDETCCIQLLNGTHRRAGAIRADIMVPVLVWSHSAIERAWGRPEWQKIMGEASFPTANFLPVLDGRRDDSNGVSPASG